MPNKPRKPRGFAALSAERRREIARQGGRASQAKGTAHQFTQEEAVVAGKKGGQIAQSRGTAHRCTSQEAIAAARKRKGWRKRQEPSS
jgi:general stress protein YciG